MLRQVLAPINTDGWRFIAIFAVATILLAWLWEPLGWIGLLATAWCVYFFRDPWRVTPIEDGIVVAPADGRVIAVVEAPPPPELGMGEMPMRRISIFLSIFDVHVNRMPMNGRVARLAYTKGKFVSANLDKASDENERMAIRLTTPLAELALVQIAGLVARRIVCQTHEGQEVMAGQRFGLIRFGSRTDLYIPLDWRPLVLPGQRAVGGETVMADAKGGAPRRGLAH